MSHALNYGDIGRVESLFIPWMSIFRGCGKHKYAAELRRYLENIHFIYPEGLRSVRILVVNENESESDESVKQYVGTSCAILPGKRMAFVELTGSLSIITFISK
jgi:hypothetical protein